MREQLKAGTMTVDITPPIGLAMAGYGGRDRPAEGVLEPLYAYAIALEQGDEACALVVADLIGVKKPVSDAIRERVASLCDLASEQVFVCTTHTHWGPVLGKTDYLPTHLNETVSEEYTATLVMDMASAVVQAWDEREPAVALAGTGWADGAKINRRPVGPDGKVVMSLVMDPEPARAASAEGTRMATTWVEGGGPGERLSEPLEAMGGNRAGVSDPSLPLLKLVRPEDGSPIGALMAFGCHPVTGGDPETTFYQYSPDWVGYAREVIEQIVGCPAAVMAGACGDQVPIQRKAGWRERVGHSVGAEALRVWEGLIGESIGPLRVGSVTAKVPVRDLPSVEEAQAALDAKDDPQGTGAGSERNMLSMAKQYAHLDFVEYEIWAMGLGDQFGLVGLPGEILEEISLQIKQQSPFEHTAVVELALESPGYFSTDAAMAEGGYEPTWSFPGEGTEAALVAAGVAALKKARG